MVDSSSQAGLEPTEQSSKVLRISPSIAIAHYLPQYVTTDNGILSSCIREYLDITYVRLYTVCSN